jgi:pilus assembly protein CpaC
MISARTLFFLGILLTHFLSPSAFAQGTEAETGNKYLILYQGVEQDETLPVLPQDPEFGGDWKGVTKAAVSREYQRVRFTPIKPGIATFTVHDRKGVKVFEYRIEVRDTKLTKMVREIRLLLSDIEGITIKIVNDRVVVDGKVIHPEDLNRIVGVLGQYGNDAASLVEVSPFAQQKIAEIIEREINNPDVQVRARNGVFVLTGEVQSEYDKTQAELIARTYVPGPTFGEAEKSKDLLKAKRDNVANLLFIRPPPQVEPQPKLIQVVIHYVELSKDYSNSSRFQWTPGISDQTNVSFTRDSRQPSGIVASITGTISNLLPRLNWAKGHGHARILKTTSMITKDGIEATMDSITKVPVVSASAQGVPTNLPPIEYGTSASVTPKVLSAKSDAVNLAINIRVSDVIGNSSAGPSTSTNNLKTNLDVRSGESAAIGGFITNNHNMNYNKLPPDVQNPLFSLYSSKEFQKGQSQFVIFVTPIIKASASSGVEKIKEKFRLNE